MNTKKQSGHDKENKHLCNTSPYSFLNPFLASIFEKNQTSMAMTMAPQLLFLLITTILTQGVLWQITSNVSLMDPYTCSQNNIRTCDAYLYHISRGLKMEQIASYYQVNSSQIKSINHRNKDDYLISVPCTCQDINATTGYFYNSIYKVKIGDGFASVSNSIYSGQAWSKGGGGELFAGEEIPIHLLCGCLGSDSKVVTYTVQDGDTLNDIAKLFSSSLGGIQSLNEKIDENPSYIDVGWVFFVPMGIVDAVKEGERHQLS